MEKGRGVHNVLVGKPGGKRALGKPRFRFRIILTWIFRKLERVEGTAGSE
jgi:hypothetical protein